MARPEKPSQGRKPAPLELESEGVEDRQETAAPNEAAEASSQSSRQSGGTRSSRWQLRNWRLRTKLVAVLLLPTLAALFLGQLRVFDQIDAADEYARNVRGFDVVERSTDLIHELQRERDVASSYIARGRVGGAQAVDDQVVRVDQDVQRLRDSLGQLDDFDTQVITSRTRALERLGGLAGLRGAVRETQYSETAAIKTYTSIIQFLLQMNRDIVASITDSAVSAPARATEALARAKEEIAQQRATLLAAGHRDELREIHFQQLQASNAQFSAAVNEFYAIASPSEANLYSDTVAGPAVDDVNSIKGITLVRHQNGIPLGLNSVLWDQSASTTIGLTREVELELQGDLRARGESLADQARMTAFRDAALVLGFLVGALVLMLFVARSMLRPLRVLRKSALEVAHERLPSVIAQMRETENDIPKVTVQSVDIHTREEIGQLARAFDAVHNEAVRLAAEQALLRANVNAMFVNLSRRSQTLVERQLGLIDRLERDEQDPDQLANLFELDHLATRMRRNSENLLVLAGTETTRRMARPVPVTDILGAAVSEVEQYARVTVSATPELMVQGRAVNDLVHLIAELLDNATALSDPQTKVTVRTAHSRKNELIIEITDRGVGMADDELAEVNERLANPPRVDVGVSRRMGLYVVAQLAKRHEIRVRLRSEYLEGGIIALVVVPSNLVVRPTSLRSSGHTGTQALAAPRENLALPTVVDDHTGGDSGAGSLPALPSVAPEPGPMEPFGEQLPSDPALSDIAKSDSTDYFGFYGESAESELRGGYRNPAEEEQPQSGGPGGRPAPEDTAYFTAAEMDDAQEPDEDEWEAQFPQQDHPQAEAAASHDDGRQGAVSRAPVADERSSGAAKAQTDFDAPTERLPIYEAVLSQWFQAGDGAAPQEQPNGSAASARQKNTAPKDPAARNTPAAPQRNGVPPTQQQAPQRREAAAPPPAARRRPPQAQPDATQRPVPPAAGRTPSAADATPGAAPTRRQPVRSERPTSTATPSEGQGWHSAGDDGWEAAKTVLAQTPEGVTQAGLPKRVPKAKLMPGSVAPQTKTQRQAAPEQSDAPPRSAEMIRGKMSNFQQGLRKGRHHRVDALAAPGSSTDPSHQSASRHDEEQE
ncbi:signal transduction histidine kinase [Actinoalloteichus hoggarensis]|uniref:histidine kinase n=1 Tax=Actinoalloteichus hoggarensis TaxID=1470176 RepID=A0A221WBJ8_9PSEU|nr:nitrate- and nitrite sensing domain-containing protein [Actinoalloteichus hoggarensis]ASO22859.1 Nitrate and nitrite sensing [Actinoalloteichus hoggarensis]MBB5923999.1 signal transduction histidine kinase [Actinoalloteichus hoggarensis]